MSAWKQRLRSPRGQVQLMAATLLGAAVFAGALGTQQAFFERYIVEKPPPVEAATRRLATRLDGGERVDLDSADRTRLYELWLQEPGSAGAGVAQALGEASDWLCARVERSLVAGSTAQRLAAIDLAQRAEQCTPVLDAARERARAMGPAEVLDALNP
ncbi:MAG: hypothetical protein EP330_23970 [Deltaproteobacteria bacterium]|nr:MAG: hypothetical protein EP330_23970 [Deltaproteobacteria bacterium]